MKEVKTILVMKGVEILSLVEIRKNCSPEILGHFRTGNLSRWLVSQGLVAELLAVEAVDRSGPIGFQLDAICRVFKVTFSQSALQDFLDWDEFFTKVGCGPSDFRFESALKLARQEMRI